MKLDHSFLVSALPSAQVVLAGHEYPLTTAAKVLAPFATSDHAVSIDTRTMQSGDIFIALPGNSVDGHDFVDQAIEKGAAALIVSCSIGNVLTIPVIVVDDTYWALSALAAAWRRRFTIPIVGITGSMGKTSTKEMVRTILHEAGKNASVSYGNQNSEIGLALNLLSLHDGHEVGVFEVGINAPGEMKILADMLQPTMGLITCIAHTHIGYLGALADVAREKRQLFANFAGDHIGIVPGDQQYLGDIAYPHPVIRFGMKMNNHIHARNVQLITREGDLREQFGVHFTLKLYGKKAGVTLQTCNTAMVRNALGASAVSHLLGIDLRTIVDGLRTYRGYSGRFELLPARAFKGLVVNDCYNACPESMKGALQTFDSLPTVGPKIAVLGDMLELGNKEQYWHRSIGRMLHRLKTITHLVLVGPRAKAISQTAPLILPTVSVASWQEAEVVIAELVGPNAFVLLKASRGVGLSNLVPRFSNIPSR